MTTGAYDWTYFSVNGYHFLAAAQAFDGFSTLTDSRIYVLQDKKFVLFQTMEVIRFLFYSLKPYLPPFKKIKCTSVFKKINLKIVVYRNSEFLPSIYLFLFLNSINFTCQYTCISSRMKIRFYLLQLLEQLSHSFIHSFIYIYLFLIY